MSLLIKFVLLSLYISKCLADINLVNTLAQISTRPLENLVDKAPNFIETAAEDGYKAEEYEVTTEDGYILTLHRLILEKQCPKKLPVLLMPGLLQSAECYIDTGAGKAPAYILLNECYDVWIGNFRGTKNSRKHVTLNPDKDSEFWQFDVEQTGKYDVPAMIDYVLEKTDFKKLIYVGFSNGGGCFLVMNSERPEYAAKISLFVGLSPATRLPHLTSLPIRALLRATLKFHRELKAVGVGEVFTKGFPSSLLITTLCQLEPISLCPLVTRAIDTLHLDSVPVDVQKRIYRHVPAGLSLQFFAFYGQQTYNEVFKKFDYGPEENLKMYGTSVAPEYDLSKVKMPTVIYNGAGDTIVDRKDAEWLVDQLPNVLEFNKIEEDPKWNHVDMSYSLYWKETIFESLKKYLNKYSNDNADSSEV